MNQRNAALWYVERFLGMPYVWGGDDAVAGFDCSGLMVEVLQGVGVLPRGDWSAEMLRKRFRPTATPIPGCLAFRLGADGRAVHVEMVFDTMSPPGGVVTIGASGGTSATKTAADAVRDNAFVKLRPVWPGAVYADPFLDPVQGDV